MSDPPVLATQLPLELLHRGKVRDVYAVDDEHLLLIASDRVSAFDVVLEEPIPRKGEVLTQLTAWWLHNLRRDLGISHHIVAVRADEVVGLYPALGATRPEWEGRATLVRRTTPIRAECVYRGYLAGSAWKEYEAHGTLAGERIQMGLQQCQRLDPPLFSPATKAEHGLHDENITFSRLVEMVGEELAEELRHRSHMIFRYGRDVAADSNLLLADTKFEFGHDAEGELLLIDEVLTPDSSRFWPKEVYRVGQKQPSLDKQPIRDFLEGIDGWDKTPPPPPLPPEVVQACSERYLEVFRRLTGIQLDDWTPPTFGALNR